VREPEALADPRAQAVGGDDEVGPVGAPVGQLEHARGVGALDHRAGDDLGARAARLADQRLVEVRARRDDEPVGGPGVAAPQHRVGVVDDLPGGDMGAVADGLVEDAERLERGQAVLPQPDPGAEHPQVAAALVDAHAPAALGQRGPREQPREAGARDLSVPRLLGHETTYYV